MRCRRRQGCDGFVLLDGKSSEKVASPNFSLRGFEEVDAAKADALGSLVVPFQINGTLKPTEDAPIE